jgi:membrane-bound lytic murein transglycosylase D
MHISLRTLTFAHLLLASLGMASSAVVATAGPGETSAAFPEPDQLAPAVAFWTRVYTEVDTNSGLIHDRSDLQVIYQVLHLNPYVVPAVQDKRIERVVARYQQALRSLAAGKRSALTKTEQRALRAWGGDADTDTLCAAADRVRFQRGQSNRFRKGLIRSAKWQAQIAKILQAQGLPLALMALPHLESSYNPEARSKAGAAGLWQLMPETARRYLRVDDQVDERLDPYKSSEAAARLLQHNFAVLKSWPLALTAYNHGLSGTLRGVRDAGTTDIGKLMTDTEGGRFGFASRNFYAAFLAALKVSRNVRAYFGDSLEEPVADPVVVDVPAYLPVAAITEAFDIDRDYLRALNPSLPGTVWSDDKFVPKDYGLRLPPHLSGPEAAATIRRLGETFGYASQKPDVYHEVQPGESLSEIAERYGTSVLELVAMNRLPDQHWIRAGRKLLVATGPPPKRLTSALTYASSATSDMVVKAAEPIPSTAEGALVAALRLTSAVISAANASGSPVTKAQGLEMANAAPAQGAGAQREDADRAGPPAEDQASASSAAAEPDDGQDANASPLEAQPKLAADPADYSVAPDSMITIQAAETLGHYADWLGLRSSRLQQINKLKPGEALVVGHRLKLDFSNGDRADFEQRRIAYHQALQSAYFRHFHIRGVRDHRIKEGDNLWILATREYEIPFWLLRQYNPEINLDTVLPKGQVISIPIVQG